MSKFVGIFLVIALWAPCLMFMEYVSTSQGRNSFAEASTTEWWIMFFLAVAPYFVLSKIQMKNDDQ